MSERLRLFVALDLPAAARDALATWCDRVAPAAVRRIAAHDLHLTLAFLGPRVEADATTVAHLLPEVALAHPVRCLRTTRALWLGPRRPSVLTVAIEPGDELSALRAGLVAALAAAIGFDAERRPFRPHVTVGRVGGGARAGAGASLPEPPPTRAGAGASLPEPPPTRAGAGASLPEPPPTRAGAGASLPEPPPTLAVAPHALTLYRSHADRRGARYEPLARELLG